MVSLVPARRDYRIYNVITVLTLFRNDGRSLEQQPQLQPHCCHRLQWPDFPWDPSGQVHGLRKLP